MQTYVEPLNSATSSRKTVYISCVNNAPYTRAGTVIV